MLYVTYTHLYRLQVQNRNGNDAYILAQVSKVASSRQLSHVIKPRGGGVARPRALCVLIHKPCCYPGRLIESLQQYVTLIIILCEPAQNYGNIARKLNCLYYPCCNIETSIFIPGNMISNTNTIYIIDSRKKSNAVYYSHNAGALISISKHRENDYFVKDKYPGTIGSDEENRYRVITVFRERIYYSLQGVFRNKDRRHLNANQQSAFIQAVRVLQSFFLNPFNLALRKLYFHFLSN